MTLTLEDDKWMKGVVNTGLTDVPTMLTQDPNASEKIVQDSFSNLGLNLVHRVFHKAAKQIKENEEQKVKDALGSNYQDSLNAMAIYKSGDAKKIEAFTEVTVDEEHNEIEDFFWYITEGKSEKPIWVSNCDQREKPLNSEALVSVLPV